MRKLLIILPVISLGTLFCFFSYLGKSGELLASFSTNTQVEQESTDVRLARAHVKLAKLEVERALEVNKRNANTYSAEYIELLKLHILIDEAELEQKLRAEQADEHEVCVKNAEATLKIAKSMLAAFQDVHKKAPSSSTKFDLEQASVNVEIAELELEQAKQLESHDTKAVLLHLQRQVERLRHQVMKLQVRP
jgi:hypothetical protein